MTRKTSIHQILSLATFACITFTLFIALDGVARTQSTTVFRGPAVYPSGGSLGWIAAVEDLRGNGEADIVVVNYSGLNGEGNGSVGVLLRQANGTFQPAVVYDSGGGGPTNIAIKDLNGDAKPDLVVANQGCPGLNTYCLGVLLGNGDGTFKSVVTYPDGGWSWSGGGGMSIPLMIADVNADGKPDLVVVNQTDRNYGHGVVSVLMGNGDGTFRPALTYDSGGFGAFSASVADVNRDGNLDVVVLNCVSTGPNDCQNFNQEGAVGILVGNGDGTFQPARTYGSGSPAFSSPLVVADVNGDGKPDILVGNSCPNNNCSAGHGPLGVLLGNGDGTFHKAATYDPESAHDVLSIALGDLNGDGKLDVAIGGSGIGVFLGNGDGTFQPVRVFPSLGSSPVFAADFNHDGILDLLGIAATSGSAAVFLGNGDGTFQTEQDYKLGGKQFSQVTLADLNGDTKPDLVAANWCCRPTGYELGTVGVLTNISKLATSATLVSSLNPAIYGQKVTWTATVSASGTIPATGRVTFSWSGHTLGSPNLDANGVATLSKSNLAPGSYPVTAAYKGDTNNFGSTSPVVNQVVQQATISATLTSSRNPSTQGQIVKFTATLTSNGGLPAGQVVTFTYNGQSLGTGTIGSAGKATLSTAILPTGSDLVTATYAGDANHSSATTSIVQTVN